MSGFLLPPSLPPFLLPSEILKKNRSVLYKTKTKSKAKSKKKNYHLNYGDNILIIKDTKNHFKHIIGKCSFIILY